MATTGTTTPTAIFIRLVRPWECALETAGGGSFRVVGDGRDDDDDDAGSGVVEDVNGVLRGPAPVVGELACAFFTGSGEQPLSPRKDINDLIAVED